MAITEEKSESSQQPKAENVKITIDDQIQSMRKKFSQYYVKDQKPIVGCNYSVPDNIRKENEDAYTPTVVSIGPIHHGKPQLQAVERFKWMFLGWYLDRPSSLSFDEMVRAAIDIEEQARMSYLERFDNISSQEFSEMIILDFIFLIEIFFQIDTDNLAFQDSIFLDILNDMMLLENQLPQRVVTSLFDTLYKKKDDNLGDLILNYISYHIVESPKAQPNDWKSATDMLDFIMTFYDDKIKSTLNAENKITWLERTHSAIELREAGVEFSKVENADFLLDVKFEDGELKMPIIKIEEFTEILFQNMIACEQTRRDNPKRISGYINLLSSLVKGPKDVVLLSDCGIIQYPDHDVEDVVDLFETVVRGLTYDPTKCYFWGLSVEMHTYSRKNRPQWKGSWFKWKRILREDYFSSPWSIISFIAAFMLLVLTVIQTAYAIKYK